MSSLELHRDTTALRQRPFGRYLVKEVIGKGGMSTVYRAIDTRLGRQVALKVIDPVLAEDAEFRQRFIDEARNTSAIDHPHVVPLFDSDEHEGHLYIAMRYVDGHDLAALVDPPMPIRRVLGLLAQVADALHAVHSAGLVHLDVKPANVLVAARDHVYLADFGLTRHGAIAHRTRGGDFLGSPTYAAPEHLRGDPVDAASDVYSLTCVLYACVAGRAPYRGTVTEVIDQHLENHVPSLPAAVPPELRRRLDPVIRQGMTADRARRFTSAPQLLAAAHAAAHAAARDRDMAAASGPHDLGPRRQSTGAGGVSNDGRRPPTGATPARGTGPSSALAPSAPQRLRAPVPPGPPSGRPGGPRPLPLPVLVAGLAVAVGVLVALLVLLL